MRNFTSIYTRRYTEGMVKKSTSQFGVHPWTVTENHLDDSRFRLGESIMSLGNGHMGIRGNFEETYSGDTHQGTYIAGVWFPDKTRVGWWKIGYPEYFGKVINAVNYIGIRVFIDDVELDLHTADLTDYQRELDMRSGVLTRQFTATTKGKTVQVKAERFLSVANSDIAAIRYSVKALDFGGTLRLIPLLDASVTNLDANYEERFWEHAHSDASDGAAVVASQTRPNPFGTPTFRVAAAMRCDLSPAPFSTVTTMREHYADNELTASIKQGQEITLTKLVAVVTDRDHDRDGLVDAAEVAAEAAYDKGYEQLKAEHQAAWRSRWDRSDVDIEGDPAAQQGIRFNLFQLFSTYYGEDARLNIGPKGFTGEKYGGATYWDTEAYALPLYLATADSHVARNLCLYRFEQLDGAYHNAKQQGLAGALFPMVTFNGIECHNEWEITFEEIHRNGAIAYGIYNYVNYTDDHDYLAQYGITVLIGISRFWADRVHYSERTQQYMMHGVTGPNEYENNINNNWYTNYIAVWTLRYTLEVIEQLHNGGDTARFDALDVSQDEQSHWQDIIDNMYFPYDAELDVFVQHDTFLDKDLRTADTLDPAERPINQNWSWDKILRSPFIKQADVLQGFYFFGHEFDADQKRRNFEFYEPMTVHESSLSPCIHSILAAELGMEDKAYEMYQRTARLDLDNYNNDTDEGLHITSMTGSWLAIVQGFAGMRTYDGQLSFAPFLPSKWQSYNFRINYRGHDFKITVSREQTKISQQGDEVTLTVHGQQHLLAADGELTIKAPA
jgi:maltose phosphorylase